MNETTMEMDGLDDPALLAEIEAEFAELTAEIQRISAMPASVGPRKSELLEALRASWRERLKLKTADRPEWRQRLDDTIGRAVDRLLEDGLVENADGSIGFALRGDTIQNEGGPLLRGLLDGLSNMLTEKFPPPEAAANGAGAGGAAANNAAANPLQGLLGGLGQMLAGALKSAVSQVGTQSSVQVPTGAGDMKIVVTPAAPAEGTAQSGKAVDMGAVDFQGEQELKATFEVDTRKTVEGGAPNTGTEVFFKQLFAGLGQAVRQAVTPQPSEDAKAEATAPPSPLSGLGQLFLGAIQKAFTPPTQNPATPSQPTTAAEGPAAAPPEAAPTTETQVAPEASSAAAAEPPAGEALNVRIPQVNAEPSTGGEPTPALNVDIAGLLRQLLGNIKPPS